MRDPTVFRGLVDYSTDFIGMATLDGRPVYINPAGRELVGLASLEAALELELAELVTEEMRAVWNGEIVPTALREGHWQGETQLQHLESGTRIDVELSLFVVPDADGTPLCFATATRDITQRKSLERLARTEEERQRTLLEVGTAVVWRTDPLGRFHDRQPTWETYTGQTWHEYEGFGWVEAIHPDDRDALLAVWRNSVARAEFYEHHARFWCAADRDYHFCEVRGVPIVDDDQRLVEWTGFIVDVHHRRQLEAELRSQAARLRSLEDADTVGVMCGIDDQIIEANDYLLDLLGYTQAELDAGDLRWSALTPDGYATADAAVFAEVLASGSAPPYEKELLRKDGARVPVLVAATRLLDPPPLEWFALVTDLTQRKRAEDRLRSIAGTLQASLLPKRLPAIEGVEMAARYWPAVSGEEVGGDFYDVVRLEDDAWCLFVGDVCGKGIEAAALTSLARHTLRAAAFHLRSPAQVLSWLHDAVYTYEEADTFCTALFARFEPDGECWRGVVSLGGHAPAVLVPHDGAVRLVGTTGTLLGMLPDVRLADTTVSLRPGDMLVAFTDGITDLPPPLGLDAEGLLAMIEAARASNVELLADAIAAAIDERRSRSRTDDDAALVVVGVTDTAGLAPPRLG